MLINSPILIKKTVIMVKFYRALVLLLVVSSIYSCGDSVTGYKPNITGKPGVLVAIAPASFWDDEAGDTLKSILTQPVLSLPNAAEPIFDLVDIEPNAFGSIFQTARNLLFIKIKPEVTETKIQYREDVWARPQSVAVITGKDKSSIERAILESEGQIPSYFLKAERERLKTMYRTARFNQKDVDVFVQNKFDISLKAPKGYIVAVDTTDFSWIRFETPETSRGIFVWSVPYTDERQFTEEYVVATRDSILKLYVPGPSEGSYMTTETRAGVVSRITKHEGSYAINTRGLWRTENNFMGGPWVGLSVLDEKNSRIVTVEGFVYAPKKDKRNYVREMEAIIESVVLNYSSKRDSNK